MVESITHIIYQPTIQSQHPKCFQRWVYQVNLRLGCLFRALHEAKRHRPLSALMQIDATKCRGGRNANFLRNAAGDELDADNL